VRPSSRSISKDAANTVSEAVPGNEADIDALPERVVVALASKAAYTNRTICAQ